MRTAKLDYVRLQLTYARGKDYRRIKIRILLDKFGYKRRTEQLVEFVERTLGALGLVAYLKDYVPCKILDNKLDDTIIIRSKER